MIAATNFLQRELQVPPEEINAFLRANPGLLLDGVRAAWEGLAAAVPIPEDHLKVGCRPKGIVWVR